MLLGRHSKKGFGLIDALIATLACSIAIAALLKAAWITIRHFNRQHQELTHETQARNSLVASLPENCSLVTSRDGLKLLHCEVNNAGRRVLQSFLLN